MQPSSLIPLMRWFGPRDPVPLAHLAQAGCEGVVSALHDIPPGEVWPEEAIRAHQAQIEVAGLRWEVVESLPVCEAIKRGDPGCERFVEAYAQSLRHLARAGIRVVTYNFMPVLDWVRTDLAYRLPNGAEALRFVPDDFAVVELFLLRRPNSEAAYAPAERSRLQRYYEDMPEAQRERLLRTALLALPGTEEAFSPAQVREALAAYANIDTAALRTNLVRFLSAVVPVAAAEGMGLALHPDDPPFPVLGLPRVVSTAADLTAIFEAVPHPANGLCFCSGSLGVRPEHDLPALLERWGERVHFLHFRNTRREADGSFTEASHLEGDTDMHALLSAALAWARRRGQRLPFRPDHGHRILSDFNQSTYPGYSAVGRLKGLAELRGLCYGLEKNLEAAPTSPQGA